MKGVLITELLRQRVAIARALIYDTLILTGDESAGNLDKKNSDKNVVGFIE